MRGTIPDRLTHVRITRNHIHHNQKEGRGYGVVANRGAFPLIDGNTFDSNRHAIAADGLARTGYRALNNLVLRGGGKDGNSVYCWYEQHFNMHGQSGESHTGGNAGDFVEIAWNTFRGEQEYGLWPFKKTRAAFHLRGTPCDRDLFHDKRARA